MDKSRRTVLASVVASTFSAGAIVGADRYYRDRDTPSDEQAQSAQTTATATVQGTIPPTTEDSPTTASTTTTTTETATETATETTDSGVEQADATENETTTNTTTPPTTTTTTETATATPTPTPTTETTTKAPAEIEVESQATRINRGTDDEKLQITATAANVGGEAARTQLFCTIYTSVGDGLDLGVKSKDVHEPGVTWEAIWEYSGGGRGDDELDDYTDYEVTVETGPPWD